MRTCSAVRIWKLTAGAAEVHAEADRRARHAAVGAHRQRDRGICDRRRVGVALGDARRPELGAGRRQRHVHLSHERGAAAEQRQRRLRAAGVQECVDCQLSATWRPTTAATAVEQHHGGTRA
eukprot:365603-Chlamydomonas_euryale.AAC.6